MFILFYWPFPLSAVTQTLEEKDLRHPPDPMMMTTRQMVTMIPTRSLPHQPHLLIPWGQDLTTTDSTRKRLPASRHPDHPRPQEPIRQNLYISESEKNNTSHNLSKKALLIISSLF